MRLIIEGGGTQGGGRASVENIEGGVEGAGRAGGCATTGVPTCSPQIQVDKTSGSEWVIIPQFKGET